MTEPGRDRAALVALLRVRLDKLAWPEITTEVVEVGSATAVWERHVPATLLSGTDEEALVQAAADVELWRARGTSSRSSTRTTGPVAGHPRGAAGLVRKFRRELSQADLRASGLQASGSSQVAG